MELLQQAKFKLALKLPTSREVAAHILYAEPIQRALIDARADGEASLRDRFERAKQEGDLPEPRCASLLQQRKKLPEFFPTASSSLS